MAFVISLGVPADAVAACNIIPGTLKSFRSALGTTNRPFATPGDWVELNVSSPCHAASAGFSDDPADHIVSVVFKPPNGPANVVILATDCAPLENDRQICEARPSIDTATCVQVSASVTQPPIELDVFERDGERNFRFRFPNTDAMFAPPLDDVTLSGPVAIAVSSVGDPDPLPCSLANETCESQGGLAACVDELFDNDGSCGDSPRPAFPHFTGLPLPNDYERVCTEPAPPCDGEIDSIRFTIDTAGNVLIPMDWRGVLVDRDSVPVARLLRASSGIEAFEGMGAAITIPGQSFLASYSPEGGKLPPIFDPQSDPEAIDAVTFFGSADAPSTVLRLARRSSGFQECDGGTNSGLPCNQAMDCPDGGICGSATCRGGTDDGLPCASDVDCPEAECGPGLFDFSTRFAGGVGPVVLEAGKCVGGANGGQTCTDDLACDGGSCGDFALAALDPVPLDGLLATESLSAFVVAEAIADTDFNADGDDTDHVIKLIDRSTGVLHPIGAGAGEGRAVVRIQQPPFSFAAVAGEGDIIAFLESEPAEGNTDANGDGDVFDSILRVFRQSGPDVVEVSAGMDLAVEAAPLVNDRSVVVSNGRVIFRSSEASAALQETTRVSVDSAGREGNGQSFMLAMSPDGRFVAFTSAATNLVAGDANGFLDAFVHDRTTGQTTRVSVDSAGSEANGDTYSVAISDDGRFVAFTSDATNLVANDTNGLADAFVHDRTTGQTTRVSVDSAGSEANGVLGIESFGLVGISGDGRFVAFTSDANLVANDTNGRRDAFVHDRTTGQTTRVSVDSAGLEAIASKISVDISADGRFVAFAASFGSLDRGQNFVHDRATGETMSTIADLTRRGDVSASISADGRVVAHTVWGSTVAGDTNDAIDVYVQDRATGQTRRASVDSAGAESNHRAFFIFPAISANGRFIAFDSDATNLVADDTNDGRDVFVHDLITGHTARVSVDSAGTEGNPAFAPWLFSDISADGRIVAFASTANNLVAGDTNDQTDVFVRGPDPTDVAADLSGDGVLDDTVLRVLDASAGRTDTVTTLCPAEVAAVAGDVIAFTRPESAGPTGNPECVGPDRTGTDLTGPDLNADLDANDAVVFTWSPDRGVENLLCAATDVALSSTHLAALVSEARQGDTNLNADADSQDLVVFVREVGAAAASDCESSWTNLGQAADVVEVSGSRVVFITDESSQGSNLNGGDGDTDVDDRVLQVYDVEAPEPRLINAGQAAEEFVVGGGPIAFRTCEVDQAGLDLNADGDASDCVLQVYDPLALPGQRLINTGQAVTPCRLEACDPRIPYKALNNTIKFLTFECEQGGAVTAGCPSGGSDLNGDGDAGDLVLQTFNVPMAAMAAAELLAARGGGTPRYARTMVFGDLVVAGTLTTVGSVSAGICTDTAEACADDAACPAGTCFVPPGGCIEDLGIFCIPNESDCASGTFCEPVPESPGEGSCHEVQGTCRSEADCVFPATCNDADQNINRLVSPLSGASTGAETFISGGRCLETNGECSDDGDCLAGPLCGEAGSCLKDHGPCRSGADCPTGSVCQKDLLVASAADTDGDELPDPFDNCPFVANIVQEDRNGNGVGDACEAAVCGNRLVDGSDKCDDGNEIDGDGCDSNCTATGCGNGIVTVGESCDDGRPGHQLGESCNADCTSVGCGDPDDSLRLTATDVLFVLRVAVGADSCDPCVCNVDNAGIVSASDALRLLRVAVGLPVELACPPCS